MGKSYGAPIVAGVLLVGVLGWVVFQPNRREQQSQPEPPSTYQPYPRFKESTDSQSSEGPENGAKNNSPIDDRYRQERQDMVKLQLEARDITDPRVLEVMNRVPRHRFVPEGLQEAAYNDSPLPIGHDQTISQPYIVALMTQCAQATPKSRALDIGTGSGYQAAVLAELVEHVYSIEILEPLADEASRRLQELGYKNVEVRSGDGYRGWPEHAPFDLIIVAAAPDHVPQPLVDQLAAGGKLVIPVGDSYQELLVIEKQADGTVQQRNVAPVRFVPMTGEADRRK